jgi:drug/metabolite transporter (DMT)-like permease
MFFARWDIIGIMLWLVLVILVAAGWALGAFIDNYNTDVNFRGRFPQGQKVFAAVAYILTAIIIAIFWPLMGFPIDTILLLIVSGVASSIASVPYYNALKSENATGATIFVQLAPIMYLIAGWALLGQDVGPMKFLAFLVILSAPLTIILSTEKRRRRLEIWAAGLLMAYLIFAVGSNLVFIYVAGELDFATAFFWFIVGKALTDTVMIVVFKKWRKRFFDVLKVRKLKLLGPLVVNQAIYTLVEVGYRMALMLGPVAIVSVVANAAQLMLTFILGVILTLIWPVFGRERLSRRMILAHLVATILAVAGIVMMQ